MLTGGGTKLQTCQILSINGNKGNEQLFDGIIFTSQTAQPD